ncbi:MAG TPA: tRNA (adenosine(37)-N6)-threonylcarbamoyltransferase complex transferase subunit TsaD [Acidimicrobiales bacterium]|nr:tRNA (adenosine(37)-N6)-threonylcarbamoyltransferase complex transferase subunit TsaD [Acidimicrobiales bacterium]
MTGPGALLGIETSCDETAAAVVSSDGVVRSTVVSSQIDRHAAYGGVVPEIAGRAHLELLPAVLAGALEGAGLPARAPGLAAVAATSGPGLIGSLLVGLSEAKALALAWDVPFVAVNHLEGHLFAALLDHPDLDRAHPEGTHADGTHPDRSGPAWPLVVALVSGGHSLIVSMEGPGRYRLLGQTLDDAAGEAFDKVARFLGLGYPGGPAIERAAAGGDPDAFAFPRSMLADGLDLSFSGLKTAVVRAVEAHPDASNEDVAASFQQAVVDVLVAKAVRAATTVGAGGLCLAGGVAANGPLRAALRTAGDQLGIPVYLPSRAMCTDNASMIAAAAWWQLDHLGPSPLGTAADPNLRLRLLP